MADNFVAGGTAAMDSESNRALQRDYEQQVLQQMARQQWVMQQQQNEQAAQDRARMDALPFLAKMAQPPLPPPQGPQPPRPGASSPPMMPPPGLSTPPRSPDQLAMLGPGGGAPPVPPMAQAGGGLPSAPAGSALPTPPVGYRPSPSAPPELGGKQAGADPAQQPGLIDKPPIPPQMLSVPNLVQTLQKSNLSPERQARALEYMLPYIEAENKRTGLEYKTHLEALEEARKTYDTYTLKARDVGSKEATRAGNLGLKERIFNAKNDSVSGKNLDPETLDLMADQYLAGDRSVAAGLGYGNVGAGNRAALRHTIMEKAKAAGMSGSEIAAKLAEYQGIQQSERTVGARSAQVQLAASEANQMADILLSKSKEFNRTQFQPINQVLATIEKGGGGTAVRGYAAAINSFINAYARAIAPTGVATVSDKDHAREILSLADSQEQMEEIMGTLRQEMKAALAAPAEVRGALRKEVAGDKAAPGGEPPKTKKVNGVVWTLMKDKDGNLAYVDPDGKVEDFKGMAP